MMKKYNCLPGIAALALLCILASCHKPDAPEYQGFENIRLAQISGQQTLVSADLKFYNPNRFNLELRKAEVDIFLNDKPAGHSSLDSMIYIHKTDTFSIPVSLQVNLQSIFSNALQILLEKEVKIRMDGRAWLKRGGLPFSVPFHYEGKQPLSSFMQ
jgi:LEA14-like dessication related protein